MITRIWRGWTEPEHADAYERVLLCEVFPSMCDVPGFVGGEVLRRVEGGEVAFVTLMRFDSLDAVRRFAGPDYELPMIEPHALALLSRFDDRAVHFATSAFAS